MLYIDADPRLTTWKGIVKCGDDLKLYKGKSNSGDVIIRWGANYGKYTPYPENVKILNRKLYLSKRRQGLMLQEAGIRIPTIYLRSEDWQADGRPRVVTKPLLGSGGEGIVLTERPRFSKAHIVQRYIDKSREFRAMMVGNIIAFFMEKHQPDNGDFRWNERQGSVWSAVEEDKQLRKHIRQLGHAALKALQYDFGACDIILGNDGNLYILEINSRPEFGNNNAARFIKAINIYLGGA